MEQNDTFFLIAPFQHRTLSLTCMKIQLAFESKTMKHLIFHITLEMAQRLMYFHANLPYNCLLEFLMS